MEKVQNVIAIDGPSGSGKSTITKQVAKSLGIVYVDTGAMFRALAYELDRRGVAAQEDTVADALKLIRLVYNDDPDNLVLINNENFSKLIREHHVSELASRYSKLGPVRQYLLDFQRDFALKHICILEGRDIGTVVFPQAFCKFFITASPEERAKRRHLQLANLGQEVDYDKILADVVTRDEADSTRSLAPLKQADDAEKVDTSDMSETEVIELLVQKTKERAMAHNIEL